MRFGWLTPRSAGALSVCHRSVGRCLHMRGRATVRGAGYPVCQRPGEVIYVPEGWWHATVNGAPTEGEGEGEGVAVVAVGLGGQATLPTQRYACARVCPQCARSDCSRTPHTCGVWYGVELS